MDEHKYILLLNETLKRHVVTLDKRGKKRLREKFEFLENGIWDSGVRVRKLKGVSRKVIFEARLSRGDRILFTLGKHGSQTAVYIWAISKHDDIGATAQRVLPNNAPFLSFEPETTEDYPDVLIDELPREYFSQEAIEEKSSDDYGPQKWLVLNDEEWKRILLCADSDDFDIFLFLTSEQSKVLETDPPLLLSGTAGSGKTTVSVYYLLKKDFVSKKRLFLTYSPYLKEFSQRIYSGLVSYTGLDKSDMKPDFYVFSDLLQDIAQASGLNYNKKKHVGLREFENIFRNHRLHKKYDPELVWEEIRSIVKGAKPSISLRRYRKLHQDYIRKELREKDLNELKDYLLGLKCFEFMGKIERIVDRKTGYSRFDDLVQAMTISNNPARDEHVFVLDEVLKIIEKRARSFSVPLLTYQEYLNLGRKRAPNFLYERKDIYAIAEYYQSKLEELGQWDEIDLCRQAIQRMDKQANRFSYDLVVCDEVQDFADIQLSLIFRLAKSYKGIVFSGDPKQIINPSGFRWEEVKDRFYERGIQNYPTPSWILNNSSLIFPVRS
ncbi:MAG: UvrD-helicase domain-containing protein [Deltaproteobacteria bacterium]|nr:UvrD-helicase domain-containing protein [Deltaproteobacteria bacterium]